MYHRINDFDHRSAWGGPGVHLLIMVLVIALITLAVWCILSKIMQHSGHSDSAVITLRERFARSEITEEEFRSRLALLEGAPVSST